MAGSLNRVDLIGNLCADPEIKSFQSGGRIANLRLATNESWRDKSSGERKERTEFHTVSIFSDGLVGVAEKYLRKGSKILVTGQLRTRKWQDQSGNDRYSTEVVLQGPGAVLTMLDGAQGGVAQNGRNSSESRGNTGGWGAAQDDDLDSDSIPF